ncbi:HlyU family transcriptional regulator [Marinomonas mediterranea]|jgi:Uncharacterized conserved protein|uniref:Transcriptional activator HlyU n=1 Tax=Marinomonas mediterranea (strain ATCC 700492 / JCM 21426 / NBRC 103028 / MMB-1) TaxID=717774 RepID=F2K4W4_MARM1|nr:HlyU family transcriptional regulator [Marinomonas mediterranea]ADZ92607.1 Transcriptional activator HlyU [Marinomonas mediterranea MMB-1]WCN10548.1 transcriptional regulator [Marinomonas mediterranea]WCN14597.1 transcriptional regulator [Marinomonas mediterranea]WCN18645.1 transcriptional regulator [Marinomonas mediterranea MMB-1]
MSFLSGLKNLFSGADAQSQPVEESIDYNGFSITPAPISEGGQFRVAASISKGEGESQKNHKFIRSDLVPGRDQCLELTIRKAKITIDQLGDRLFD